jgi:hypothetical protein
MLVENDFPWLNTGEKSSCTQQEDAFNDQVRTAVQKFATEVAG